MVDDFNKSNNQMFNETDVFFGEPCRLEYEMSNKQKHLVNIPRVIIQSQDIRKNLSTKLNQAKERLERMIILSDESKDKNIRFTAMSSFKKKKM
ncbi:MAG: hypothetical protein MJ165_00255 [Alphaproteobacteria bacterium]|nr:hypothetical protein [Alphaproteobacteria bacterium]